MSPSGFAFKHFFSPIVCPNCPFPPPASVKILPDGVSLLLATGYPLGTSSENVADRNPLACNLPPFINCLSAFLASDPDYPLLFTSTVPTSLLRCQHAAPKPPFSPPLPCSRFLITRLRTAPQLRIRESDWSLLSYSILPHLDTPAVSSPAPEVTLPPRAPVAPLLRSS